MHINAFLSLKNKDLSPKFTTSPCIPLLEKEREGLCIEGRPALFVVASDQWLVASSNFLHFPSLKMGMPAACPYVLKNLKNIPI